MNKRIKDYFESIRQRRISIRSYLILLIILYIISDLFRKFIWNKDLATHVKDIVGISFMLVALFLIISVAIKAIIKIRRDNITSQHQTSTKKLWILLIVMLLTLIFLVTRGCQKDSQTEKIIQSIKTEAKAEVEITKANWTNRILMLQIQQHPGVYDQNGHQSNTFEIVNYAETKSSLTFTFCEKRGRKKLDCHTLCTLGLKVAHFFEGRWTQLEENGKFGKIELEPGENENQPWKGKIYDASGKNDAYIWIEVTKPKTPGVN